MESLEYKIKNLSKNIYALRISAGLTQQEFGRKIDYSGKAVSKWETGSVLPPIDVLLKIAKVYNTDLNSLFATTEPPLYYLGVDGGGTSTEFALSDKDGNIIASSTLGPCNVANMSTDEIYKLLNEGIQITCRSVPLWQISAFFGLAGAGTVKGDALSELIKNFGFSKAQYGTDAENIVSAGLNGKDGIIVIIGTGSVVFASKNNKLKKYGGYGHLFGDYASGYEIGRQGMNAVLADYDGTGPKTALTKLFEEKLNKKATEELHVFYKKSKSYIASFAPLVFLAYESGDSVAENIINENCCKLANQINVALREFDQNIVVPIILSGGLIRSADIIKPILQRNIDNKNVEIKILEERPIMGAIRLAKVLEGGKYD